MARNLNTYRASRRIGWKGSVRVPRARGNVANSRIVQVLPDWRQFTINGSAKSSEPVLALPKRKRSEAAQKIVDGFVS